MKKVRIAQIGTSLFSHGASIFETITSLPDIFEVVGYALPENVKERIKGAEDAFAGYPELTVEEILSDPTIEAVTVETEEIYLTKYAQMAADVGKHIHMEKPGGISFEDFEKLIATVNEKKTVFHTGYMYRYNPVINDFIKRAKAGEIGEIVSVEAQMSGRHPRATVEFLEDLPGGMMFFLGCHLLDLVLQIQGKPNRILPFNKSTGRFPDLDSKDFSMALLEYDRGVSMIKTTDVEMGGFARRQLVITGTDGRFVVSPLEVNVNYPLQYTGYNECFDEAWVAEGVTMRTPDYDRYKAMMEAFGEMVRGERENPYTYDYELELYRLLTECCK